MPEGFKKHQKVILLSDPDLEYIEYVPDFEGIEIKKGMVGEINLILPNGRYHLKIFDKKHNVIAYLMAEEEQIGPIKE